MKDALSSMMTEAFESLDVVGDRRPVNRSNRFPERLPAEWLSTKSPDEPEDRLVAATPDDEAAPATLIEKLEEGTGISIEANEDGSAVVIACDLEVPQPGDTVVTEKAFGQSETAGQATTFSRSDHTHGTPAEPSYTDNDEKVKVDAGDSEAGYLDGKMAAGSGITLTPSAGPNKTLTIAADAVSFDVSVTWDGDECRPKLQKGNFWYVDDVTFANGTLTVAMVQMCLPMYDVPGYCPANGTVAWQGLTGDTVPLPFVNGVVQNPEVWANTDVYATNTVTGEDLHFIVNGTTGKLDPFGGNPAYNGPLGITNPADGTLVLYRLQNGVLKGE